MEPILYGRLTNSRTGPDPAGAVVIAAGTIVNISTVDHGSVRDATEATGQAG
jgi:hypothetical protein